MIKKMRRLCGECVHFRESMERSFDGLSYMGTCTKDGKQKESLSWCAFSYAYSANMAQKQHAGRMKRLGIVSLEEWEEGKGERKKNMPILL